MDIKIRIGFESGEILEKGLTCEEYFDPIEEGENYYDDAVAKYGSALEYFDCPAEIVQWTEIDVRQGKSQDINIKTQYYQRGTHFFTQIHYGNGGELHIYSITLSGKIVQIIRTSKYDPESDWKVEGVHLFFDYATPQEEAVNLLKDNNVNLKIELEP